MTFTAADVRQLHARGISREEAERQLAMLSGPRRHLELVRACTVGDGILRLEQAEVAELHALHAEAARAGRLVKFVPASGAATRMFKSLLRFRGGDAGADGSGIRDRARQGDADAAELVAFVEQLPRFAFYEELRDLLGERGEDLDALAAREEFGPILEGLLGPEGLDYASRPKGLLKFHRSGARGRTALEEHLVEAAQYVRDGEGLCRLRLTVSRRHRPGFEAIVREAGRAAAGDGTRFEVEYSVQKPSTDTLALDADGRPLRDAEGRLILRPGGHGALIENLDELRADLVFVKNIDNVQPDRTKAVTSHWKRALAGYLVRLQREAFRLLDRLREPEVPGAAIEEGRRFVRTRLQLPAGDEGWPDGREGGRARLISLLDRPLRVCGVVLNRGEPGGGPFWVRDRSGAVTRQIVETSEVNRDDPAQREILGSATHFNPVDLVCALRDHEGRPFDLTRFVDHQAAIVTGKFEGGREVRVLERPGLWNGAMAHWNTIFVEVPIETFTPVKTVADLLRPEHRA